MWLAATNSFSLGSGLGTHCNRKRRLNAAVLRARLLLVQAPRHRHPTARCPNGPPTANRPLTLPLMPKPSQIDLDLLLRVHRCDSRGSSSLSCHSGGVDSVLLTSPADHTHIDTT